MQYLYANQCAFVLPSLKSTFLKAINFQECKEFIGLLPISLKIYIPLGYWEWLGAPAHFYCPMASTANLKLFVLYLGMEGQLVPSLEKDNDQD